MSTLTKTQGISNLWFKMIAACAAISMALFSVPTNALPYTSDPDGILSRSDVNRIIVQAHRAHARVGDLNPKLIRISPDTLDACRADRLSQDEYCEIETDLEIRAKLLGNLDSKEPVYRIGKRLWFIDVNSDGSLIRIGIDVAVPGTQTGDMRWIEQSKADETITSAHFGDKLGAMDFNTPIVEVTRWFNDFTVDVMNRRIESHIFVADVSGDGSSIRMMVEKIIAGVPQGSYSLIERRDLGAECPPVEPSCEPGAEFHKFHDSIYSEIYSDGNSALTTKVEADKWSKQWQPITYIHDYGDDLAAGTADDQFISQEELLDNHGLDADLYCLTCFPATDPYAKAVRVVSYGADWISKMGEMIRLDLKGDGSHIRTKVSDVETGEYLFTKQVINHDPQIREVLLRDMTSEEDVLEIMIFDRAFDELQTLLSHTWSIDVRGDGSLIRVCGIDTAGSHVCWSIPDEPKPDPPALLSVMEGMSMDMNPERSNLEFISPKADFVPFNMFTIDATKPVRLISGYAVGLSGYQTGEKPSPIILPVTEMKHVGNGRHVVVLSTGIPFVTWMRVTLEVESDDMDDAVPAVFDGIRIAHLPLDVNQDGTVNFGDAGAWVHEFYGLSRLALADLNQDGAVNQGDAGVFVAQWPVWSDAYLPAPTKLLATIAGSDQTVDAIAEPYQTVVADAGLDQTVDEGTTVTLDGTASSSDPKGNVLTCSWDQVSGPAVTLSASLSSNGCLAQFTAPEVDAYGAVLTFELKVYSGYLSDTDQVSIFVQNKAQPPVFSGVEIDGKPAEDSNDVHDGSVLTMTFRDPKNIAGVKIRFDGFGKDQSRRYDVVREATQITDDGRWGYRIIRSSWMTDYTLVQGDYHVTITAESKDGIQASYKRFDINLY
jgi:hypothetical protein